MNKKMDEIAFERLLLASKAVGLAVYDWDLLANQMYWNETMRDLFEIEDEKLSNYLSYFYSTIWPEDLPEVQENFRKIIDVKSNINSFEHDYRIFINNEIKYVSTKGTITRNNNGEVIRIIGACQDITIRKQEEKEKAELLRMRADLIEYIPGFVYKCSYKTDWEMEFLSDDIFDITGYTSNEIVRNSKISYNDIIFEDDRQMVWQSIDNQVKNGNTFVIEYRVKHKNGSIIWVWERGKATKDTHGNILFLEGFVQDITINVQNRNEIITLLNNTQELFVLLDAQFNIVCFNKSFKDGYKTYFDKDVEKGVNILQYAAPERKKELENLYKHILAGNHFSTSRIIADKNGQEHSFEFKYSPAKNENDEIVGVFFSTLENTAEVKAQHAERAHKHRFQSLVENARDGVAIFDQNFRPTFISQSATNILGYTEAELLQKDIAFLFHPDDVEIAYKAIAEALVKPGVKIKGARGRMLHKNGSYRWIDASVINLLNDPVIQGIVDNFSDITEVVEAENARIESESRFRLIAQTTNDYIWDYDFDKNLTWGNDNLYVFYGLEKGSDLLTKETFFDRLHPEDYNAINTLFQTTIERREPRLVGVYRLKNAEGKYREIYDQSSIIYNEHGAPKRIIGAMLDITDRNSAQQKMFDLNRRLTLATNSAEMGVFEWDYQQDIIIWDNTMYLIHQITGIEGGKMSANAWKKLISPDDIERMETELLFSIKEQENYHSSYKLISQNNDVKHIEIHAIITRNEIGIPLKIIGLCKDVTSREKKSETIRKQNEKLKEIAWTQAHVVRAPLANIMGMVDVLRFENLDNNNIEAELLMLRNSAKKLDAILREMVVEAEKMEGLN